MVYLEFRIIYSCIVREKSVNSILEEKWEPCTMYTKVSAMPIEMDKWLQQPRAMFGCTFSGVSHLAYASEKSLTFDIACLYLDGLAMSEILSLYCMSFYDFKSVTN